MSTTSELPTDTEPAGYKPPLFQNFSFTYRNYGHWDIYGPNGRMFALRGGPGKYTIRDERPRYEQGEAKEWPEFKTLNTAVSAICEELMWENLSVEGLDPHQIERWNV